MNKILPPPPIFLFHGKGMKMLNIDSYMICGNDFKREITALESYMNKLQTDIAFESSGVDSNEPDGSRLRSAYKELSDAVQKNDSKKIQEASKEVNSASAEIDEKVKDPEKKKKIIRLAIAAASAAALTVGAIVVANDLKKGDTSRIRGALDVAKKAVVKIGSFIKQKPSSTPNSNGSKNKDDDVNSLVKEYVEENDVRATRSALTSIGYIGGDLFFKSFKDSVDYAKNKLPDFYEKDDSVSYDTSISLNSYKNIIKLLMTNFSKKKYDDAIRIGEKLFKE